MKKIISLIIICTCIGIIIKGFIPPDSISLGVIIIVVLILFLYKKSSDKYYYTIGYLVFYYIGTGLITDRLELVNCNCSNNDITIKIEGMEDVLIPSKSITKKYFYNKTKINELTTILNDSTEVIKYSLQSGRQYIINPFSKCKFEMGTQTYGNLNVSTTFQLDGRNSEIINTKLIDITNVEYKLDSLPAVISASHSKWKIISFIQMVNQ